LLLEQHTNSNEAAAKAETRSISSYGICPILEASCPGAVWNKPSLPSMALEVTWPSRQLADAVENVVIAQPVRIAGGQWQICRPAPP